MGNRTAILAGRFQPYHNGHHGLAHHVLESTSDDLFVAVIVNHLPDVERSGAAPIRTIATKHHLRERNPWSAWRRCQVIRELWRGGTYERRVTVAAIPRLHGPSFWWDFATAFLPDDRYWVLKWEDEFERAKQRYFDDVGEETVGPWATDPKMPRGKVIREMLRTGRDVRDLVPGAIYEGLALDRIATLDEGENPAAESAR